MDHSPKPLRENNSLPRQKSSLSLISSISPREASYQPIAIHMNPTESENSSRSEISTRSTLSTAANFFNSHKPHIRHHHHHHHHHNSHLHNTDNSNNNIEKNFDSISKSQVAGSVNLALEERIPHRLVNNVQQTHHHGPFGMLSRSSSEVNLSEWKQPLSKHQPQQDKQKSGFFKSLKKAQTTNNESVTSFGSDISSLYGNRHENVGKLEHEPTPEAIDKKAPPSSPQISSTSKPVRTNFFKIQKHKLFEHYRFFVKFQSNAQRSDAIDYAPLRLESMNELLLELYSLAIRKFSGISLSKLATLSEKSSIAGSTSSLTMMNTLTPHDLESLSRVKSTDTTKTLNTSDTSDTTSSNSYLSPEKARSILLQLWTIQAWKMLLGSQSMIIPEIRKNSIANFLSNLQDPLPGLRKHQICFLQNQLIETTGMFKDVNSFDESELNWNMGWQLACDEPHSWVNNVFLSDWDLTSKIILDANSVGLSLSLQLLDDLDHLESSPFISLTQDQRQNFIPNYSLFTTNKYSLIPLKSGTQSIVYCHDLESSVQKNDWVNVLKEMNRVLAPGGFVQFVIKDFEIYNENNQVQGLDAETAPVRLWQLIRDNAQTSGFELRPSRKICEWLKEAGFKDIKYSLLTAPKTVTPINDQIREDVQNYESQNARNASMVSTSTDGTSSTMPAPHTRESSTTSTSGMSIDSKNSAFNATQSSLSIDSRPHHVGKKTSFYKDERLNNFSALVTGLSEYSYIKHFTNLFGVDVAKQDDAVLLDYLNYRNHGDGSGKIFYDEGYCLFMNVTAMK